MNIKKIGLIILLAAIVFVSGMVIFNAPNISTNGNYNNEDKLNVVATNFASYDFIRAIAGDKVNLTFLIGPGKESHSYDLTAQDLIKIQNSDVFIYIGGEMENWSGKVLTTIDMSKTKAFCISDYVEKQKEKEVDGAEDEHHHTEEHSEDKHYHQDNINSFDEHIWTSPNNAIKMVQALKELLVEENKENEKIYNENAEKYINEIKILQSQFKEIVDNKVRDRLVFGDKMPFQYFLDEYSLKASAAFNGCSTETEPSAATIAYLIQKTKDENIPVVLYIELNTGKVASTIADEVNKILGENKVSTMQIQTLHNVSKEDFENGESYISLMKRNLVVLKSALQ